MSVDTIIILNKNIIIVGNIFEMKICKYDNAMILWLYSKNYWTRMKRNDIIKDKTTPSYFISYTGNSLGMYNIKRLSF